MRVLLPFVIACTLLADVANMSGKWVLNDKRSRFGNNAHPSEVFLTVEHNEPKLKYQGTVNRPQEGAITDFSFDGAVDGKQYPVKEESGERKVTFHRVNDRTVESITSFDQGEVRSRITMSRDGNTMERQMTFRGKDGKTRSWVEIYEKK